MSEPREGAYEDSGGGQICGSTPSTQQGGTCGGNYCQVVKGSGTVSPTRRKERGRPNRNLEWEADLEYKEDRKECCRDWNDGECKWKERCKFKHICSARIKEGKACKSKNHSHKGHKDH